MKPEAVRQLIGLYPRAWRTRYGEEFQVLLETQPSTVRTVLNVAGWAMYERVLNLRRLIVDRRQNSLVLMMNAYLAALAGSLNFYWTVDDTPLAAAMHAQGMLFTTWNLVAAGSVLALAAVATIAVPAFLHIGTTALSQRRSDVLIRLAMPLCAGFVVLIWMAAAGIANAGHWVPTPWDVVGDWTAPANWPAVSTRWILGSVTFVLLLVGLVVSAISIRQVIHRVDPGRYRQRWFAAPSLVLAASIGVMALGVFGWGWFAQEYAGAAFHARNGGFFSSTNFASWAGSCVLFVAATVGSIGGARSALAAKGA